MIVCYRREHALDAGVHLDINAHCFFEVDGLVFLSPFSVFLDMVVLFERQGETMGSERFWNMNDVFA